MQVFSYRTKPEGDVLINNVHDFVRELLPTLIGMRARLSCFYGKARIQHQNAIISPSRQVPAWGKSHVPVSFFFWGVDH
jgi:hypothetical protein